MIRKPSAKAVLAFCFLTACAVCMGWLIFGSMGCNAAERRLFLADMQPPVANNDPADDVPVVPPPEEDGLGLIFAALGIGAYYPLLHRPIRRWTARRLMNKPEDEPTPG